MKYCKLIFVSVILIASFSLYSQEQESIEKTKCDYKWGGETLNWAFGKNGHLVFTDSTSVPQSNKLSSNDEDIDLPNGTASISDSKGYFLLFTNGIQLYSYSNGSTQLITGNLPGSTNASQSSLFIPVVDGSKYLLVVADMYLGDKKGLNYLKIEKVNDTWSVSDPKLLLARNTQKITAVRHANKQDFWLLAHGWEGDGHKYFAFQVINDSVCEPIVSEVGVAHNGNFYDNAGYMKVSSDGSRIALVLPSSGIVEVSRFNTETGIIYDSQHSDTEFIMASGLEFSPDHSKLYFSTAPNPLQNAPHRLYQLDISVDPINFNNTYILKEANPANGPYFASLQLGADGRIYVAKHGLSLAPHPSLDVIYNPDRDFEECNYNKLNGIEQKQDLFSETGSKAGLPNFVSSFLNIPYFSWTNHCHTYPTVFELRNKANNGDVIWRFYDEDNHYVGASNDGTFTFDESGDYRVEVTETYNEISYVHNDTIHIFKLPSPTLNGSDDSVVFMLPNTTIKLDAGDFDFYLWEKIAQGESEPLSEERECFFSEEGRYSITITDTNCCVNRKIFKILYSEVFFPTAFRPNSNIEKNRIFRAMGGSIGLNDFYMRIFDQWGQLIFETEDVTDGWNGKMKNSGEELSSGTYVYYVHYKTEATDFQESKEFNTRGTVVLIR